MKIQGHRLPDTVFGELPDAELVPGAYWKYLDRSTGEPMRVTESGNLTGTVWGFYGPVGGLGMGTLRLHTVREHEDGTITVAPGDGSSNSILHGAPGGRQWHGYIYRGVWEEC